MRPPPSFLGLYLSIDGEVACEFHTPDPDDPRWAIEGWVPMPASFGKVRGAQYRCQHCATDGRSVVPPFNNNTLQ